MEDQFYPKPFLSREDANKRMMVLGFRFEMLGDYQVLAQGQEMQFLALQELIAAAIAEWSDSRPEGEGFDEMNNELQDYAQEWLVG